MPNRSFIDYQTIFTTATNSVTELEPKNAKIPVAWIHCKLCI